MSDDIKTIPDAEVVGVQRVDVLPSEIIEDNGRAGGSESHKASEEALQLERQLRRKNMKLIAIVLLCLVVVILFFALLPQILDVLVDIGEELRANKSSPGTFLLCTLGALCFCSFPIPGRLGFNLVVCYVYGWIGLPIIWGCYSFGGLNAFFMARYLFPIFESRCPCCQRCCCCSGQSDGPQPKALKFIIACKHVVEDRPLQALTLLMFAPVPHGTTLMAYVFGQKSCKLTWWQYWIPVTFSGIKLIVNCYVAVKADDLEKILTGEASPAEQASTIVSVVLLIFALIVISRAARQRLKTMTAEVAQISPQITPT